MGARRIEYHGPWVIRWLEGLRVRASLQMVKEEMQWERGESRGMQGVCRRLWDPGGGHEWRELACGVASMREMGRSVGV